LNTLIPLGNKGFLWGWAVTLFTVSVAWSGRFDVLKKLMSLFVAVIVIGVLYTALRVLPPVKPASQTMETRILRSAGNVGKYIGDYAAYAFMPLL